jgi:hypothetical protein
MRAELEQRRLAGGGPSELGSTTTTTTPTNVLGSRFGLDQMPGGPGHLAPGPPTATPGTPGATRTPGAPVATTPASTPTPTPTPTPVPSQQGGWYVFEAQLSYTDEKLRQQCTSTNRWTLSFATPSQAQAFVATLGQEALKTVRDTHPEATLVSSRQVSGPSLTRPAAGEGQGSLVSVRCQ